MSHSRHHSASEHHPQVFLLRQPGRSEEHIDAPNQLQHINCLRLLTLAMSSCVSLPAIHTFSTTTPTVSTLSLPLTDSAHWQSCVICVHEIAGICSTTAMPWRICLPFARLWFSGVRRRLLPSGDKNNRLFYLVKSVHFVPYFKAQTENTSSENRLVYAAIRRAVVGWWIWSGLPRKRIGAWSVLVVNALSNGLVHGIWRVLKKKPDGRFDSIAHQLSGPLVSPVFLEMAYGALCI